MPGERPSHIPSENPFSSQEDKLPPEPTEKFVERFLGKRGAERALSKEESLMTEEEQATLERQRPKQEALNLAERSLEEARQAAEELTEENRSSVRRELAVAELVLGDDVAANADAESIDSSEELYLELVARDMAAVYVATGRYHEALEASVLTGRDIVRDEINADVAAHMAGLGRFSEAAEVLEEVRPLMRFKNLLKLAEAAHSAGAPFETYVHAAEGIVHGISDREERVVAESTLAWKQASLDLDPSANIRRVKAWLSNRRNAARPEASNVRSNVAIALAERGKVDQAEEISAQISPEDLAIETYLQSARSAHDRQLDPTLLLQRALARVVAIEEEPMRLFQMAKVVRVQKELGVDVGAALPQDIEDRYLGDRPTTVSVLLEVARGKRAAGEDATGTFERIMSVAANNNDAQQAVRCIKEMQRAGVDLKHALEEAAWIGAYSQSGPMPWKELASIAALAADNGVNIDRQLEMLKTVAQHGMSDHDVRAVARMYAANGKSAQAYELASSIEHDWDRAISLAQVAQITAARATGIPIRTLSLEH